VIAVWRARALPTALQRHAALALAVVGLGLYVAYFLFRFRFSAHWPLAPWGDASILFEKSRLVFSLADYPARLAAGTMVEVFPYSPSAVLLFRAIAATPALFMATWIVLMVSGLVLTLRGAVWQEGRATRAKWSLFACAALVIAGSSIEWDLRNANGNVIYLGFILAGYGLIGRAPFLAGTLIGLSLSLKLFSGLRSEARRRCGWRDVRRAVDCPAGRVLWAGRGDPRLCRLARANQDHCRSVGLPAGRFWRGTTARHAQTG
jgi:hypothetical protein